MLQNAQKKVYQIEKLLQKRHDIAHQSSRSSLIVLTKSAEASTDTVLLETAPRDSGSILL